VFLIFLHELLFCALRAKDLFSIRDEAPANEGRLASSANEAIVVPVAVLERDESGSANASYRLAARCASLSE